MARLGLELEPVCLQIQSLHPLLSPVGTKENLAQSLSLHDGTSPIGRVKGNFPCEQQIKIETQACKLQHWLSAMLSKIASRPGFCIICLHRWICSRFWHWNSTRTVRWGINCSGHLDTKWHPCTVRTPWLVCSPQLAMWAVRKVVVGLVSSGEHWPIVYLGFPLRDTYSGAKFCWISKLCFKAAIQLKNSPFIENLISWQWRLAGLLLMHMF